MNNDVVELLTIMNLAKQWPQLQALHDIALQDLLKMNKDAKAELTRRAEEKTKAEAAEQAKVAAKAKANAERETQPGERPAPSMPHAIPAEPEPVTEPAIERRE